MIKIFKTQFVAWIMNEKTFSDYIFTQIILHIFVYILITFIFRI
jgi:hypothetical protein